MTGDIGDGYYVIKPICPSVYYDKKQCVWYVEDYVSEVSIGCQAKRLKNAIEKYVWLLKKWYDVLSSPHSIAWQNYQKDDETLIEEVKLFIELNSIITHEDAVVMLECACMKLKPQDRIILKGFWDLSMLDRAQANSHFNTLAATSQHK